MVHITFESRDPETGYPHKLPAGSLSLSSQHNSVGESRQLSIPHRFTIVLVIAFLVPLILAGIMAL